MNLEKLLKELHAEKRRLDAMIGALETASKSPAHRFIRTLERSLGHRRGWRLAPRTKAELGQLAQQVRHNGGSSHRTRRQA